MTTSTARNLSRTELAAAFIAANAAGRKALLADLRSRKSQKARWVHLLAAIEAKDFEKVEAIGLGNDAHAALIAKRAAAKKAAAKKPAAKKPAAKAAAKAPAKKAGELDGLFAAATPEQRKLMAAFFAAMTK